jgi:hypothetical protein
LQICADARGFSGLEKLSQSAMPKTLDHRGGCKASPDSLSSDTLQSLRHPFTRGKAVEALSERRKKIS